jgi:hypothetical protein
MRNRTSFRHPDTELVVIGIPPVLGIQKWERVLRLRGIGIGPHNSKHQTESRKASAVESMLPLAVIWIF